MAQLAISSKLRDPLPFELTWTEGFDDSTLRTIQVRLSQLAVTRDIKMFTWSIHCTHELVNAFLESPPNPVYTDLPMQLLLRDKEAELNSQMEVWSGWDPLLSIASYAMIRNVILDCARRIPVTKTTKSFWRQILAGALGRDRSLCTQVILNLFSSKSRIAQQFSLLSPNEKRAVLNVCQSLIDAQVPEHLKIERYLKYLVRHTGILPHYLFVSGIERHGNNPLMGGGFADIWRGEFNKQPVALKVLRLFGHGEKHQKKICYDFCKEAMIWRQLNHENVLPLYGVNAEEFNPRLAMVLPWMPYGHMMEYLKNHPNANRTKLVNGVAAGLHYLHGLKPQVIHGDLRGVNVLIDERRQPRIADFGLARVMDSQATTVNPSTANGKGNCHWQSPELLQPNFGGEEPCKTTAQSDIFSFACVILEIFTGKPPFHHLKHEIHVFMAVVQNNERPPHPGLLAIECGLTDDIWQLMQDCWSSKPSDRPLMSTIMQKLPTYSGGEGKFNDPMRDSATPDVILNMLHIFDLTDVFASEGRDKIEIADSASSSESPISASLPTPTNAPSFQQEGFFEGQPVSRDPESMDESVGEEAGDTDSDNDNGFPSGGSPLEKLREKPSHFALFVGRDTEKEEDAGQVNVTPLIKDEPSTDEVANANSENENLNVTATILEDTERQLTQHSMINPLYKLVGKDIARKDEEERRLKKAEAEAETQWLEEEEKLKEGKRIQAERDRKEKEKQKAEQVRRKREFEEREEALNRLEALREERERQKMEGEERTKKAMEESREKDEKKDGRKDEKNDEEEQRRNGPETGAGAQRLKEEGKLEEAKRREALREEHEKEEGMREMKEMPDKREREEQERQKIVQEHRKAEAERREVNWQYKLWEEAEVAKLERIRQELKKKLQEGFRRREEEIKRKKQEMKAQTEVAQVQPQASHSSDQIFSGIPESTNITDSGTNIASNPPAWAAWVPNMGTFNTTSSMSRLSPTTSGNRSATTADSSTKVTPPTKENPIPGWRNTEPTSFQSTPQSLSIQFSAEQLSEWQRRREEYARKQHEQFRRVSAAQSGQEHEAAQAPTHASSSSNQTLGGTPQTDGGSSRASNASHPSTGLFWTPKTGVRSARPMAKSSSARFRVRSDNSVADSITKDDRQHTEDVSKAHPNLNQQERGQQQKDYNRIWEEMSTNRRKERAG